MLSPRAAVRWSLSGKHEGWGMFDEPSGAEVYVMGFTHRIWSLWIKKEFTLFDQFQFGNKYICKNKFYIVTKKKTYVSVRYRKQNYTLW